MNDTERTYVVLGGSNGLRGYPAAQFGVIGGNRMRANIEYRSLPIVIESVHIGAVAFYDAGTLYPYSCEERGGKSSLARSRRGSRSASACACSFRSSTTRRFGSTWASRWRAASRWSSRTAESRPSRSPRPTTWPSRGRSSAMDWSLNDIASVLAAVGVAYVASVALIVAGGVAVLQLGQAQVRARRRRCGRARGVPFVSRNPHGALHRARGRDHLPARRRSCCAPLHQLHLLPPPRVDARGTPVLVIPGYIENAGTVWWLARRLARAGFNAILIEFPDDDLRDRAERHVPGAAGSPRSARRTRGATWPSSRTAWAA